MSFGFKYRRPEANHIIDVSAIPNPARTENWTLWSDIDNEMRLWVANQPKVQELMESLISLLGTLVALDDGVRMALGCSSGRHRSPILVDELATHALTLFGPSVVVRHLELNKEYVL